MAVIAGVDQGGRQQGIGKPVERVVSGGCGGEALLLLPEPLPGRVRLLPALLVVTGGKQPDESAADVLVPKPTDAYAKVTKRGTSDQAASTLPLLASVSNA